MIRRSTHLTFAQLWVCKSAGGLGLPPRAARAPFSAVRYVIDCDHHRGPTCFQALAPQVPCLLHCGRCHSPTQAPSVLLTVACHRFQDEHWARKLCAAGLCGSGDMAARRIFHPIIGDPIPYPNIHTAGKCLLSQFTRYLEAAPNPALPGVVVRRSSETGCYAGWFLSDLCLIVGRYCDATTCSLNHHGLIGGSFALLVQARSKRFHLLCWKFCILLLDPLAKILSISVHFPS